MADSSILDMLLEQVRQQSSRADEPKDAEEQKQDGQQQQQQSRKGGGGQQQQQSRKGGGGQQQQQQQGGQQNKGQQQQRSQMRIEKGRVIAAIWISEVLWVWLTLYLAVQPTETSPAWWAAPLSLGPLPLGAVWMWITLLFAVGIQIVFVYVPLVTSKNYNYYYPRMGLISLNRLVNFTGIYAAVEMLGFVPGLKTIRLQIAESLAVSDLVFLITIGFVAWWTVTISEMVSES